MRQLCSTLIVSSFLLMAATTAQGGDHMSIHPQRSHNAKRVMAKLQHASGTLDKMENRLQRFKKPEVDSAKPPALKAKNKHIATQRAEMKSTIASVQGRKMEAQEGRDQQVGINQGVKQFFEAPHCSPSSTFRVMETRFHDVCSRTDFSFTTRHWYDLGRANSAFESFCTSECVGTVNDLLQFTEGYSCFDSVTLQELRLVSAMCQRSANTHKLPPHQTTLRCGAEIAVSGALSDETSICQSAAYLNSKTMCDLDRNLCQWDRDTQMCSERITPEIIERECTDCYVKVVDILTSDYNFVCAKYQGEFCLPKLNGFNRILEQNNYDYSRSMFDQICMADPKMLPCFRSQDVGADNKAIVEARKTFTDCMTTGAYSEQVCSQYFQSQHQSIQENIQYWNMFCSKNGTGAQSEYCFRSTQAYTSSHYNSCPSSDLAAKPSCASNCAADTAKFLKEVGCCAPYLNWKPSNSLADFPKISGTTLSSMYLDRQSNNYQTWSVSHLEMCSSSRLFAWQNVSTCQNPNAWSDAITLFTVLNYTEVVKGPVREDQVQFALKLDIGKAAGVVVHDLSLQMAPKTNANGVVGTEVTFRIRGANSYRADAVAQWNSQSTHLRMQFTDDAIRTCRYCKPEKEASILQLTYDIIPGVAPDDCNVATFFTQYKKLLAACSVSSVDTMFSLQTGDLNVAHNAWSGACTSSCLTEFRAIRAGSYGSCVPTEVLTLGDLLNAGCNTDNNGKYCGAVLSVMQGIDCSDLNQTQCNGGPAKGQCRWNAKTGQCKDQFTKGFLQPYCDGGCITTLTATIGMNSDHFAKEAKLMDTLFCSKDGNDLCLPLIQNDLNEIDEYGLTQRVVHDMCNTTQKLRCLKRVYGAIASDMIGSSEMDFYYCVETVLDDGTVTAEQKVSRIETACIENVLAASLSAVDQTNAMLNNMCSKNRAGQRCMHLLHKYENSTCLSNMLFNNQCPANCVAEIEAAITDIGCCAGNLQDVHGFVPFANLPVEDIPEFDTFETHGEDFGAPMPMMNLDGGSATTGGNNNNMGTGNNNNMMMMMGGGSGSKHNGNNNNNKDNNNQGMGMGVDTAAGVGAIPLPVGFMLNPNGNEDMVLMPKWYFFANYQTCQSAGGSLHAGDLVYRKCKKVRGTSTATKSLAVGVSFETISATEKKQKRFEKKLTYDLAVKLGMSFDDFPSLGMKKDSSKVITLGGSTGAPPARSRRSTASTATSSTTTDISIQTESEADTTAASTTYDSLVASGSLTLSSLISLVKNECSNCTAAGTDYTSVAIGVTSATLTSVYGTTTGTTSGSGSSTSSSSATGGAATTSVMAAAIAAIVTIALFSF